MSPTETLGQFLKRERESKNIPLESIAQSTKISLAILKNIEADQLASLPKGPYLKGFLRNYALATGLNLEEVFSRYQNLPQEFQMVKYGIYNDPR